MARPAPPSSPTLGDAEGLLGYHQHSMSPMVSPLMSQDLSYNLSSAPLPSPTSPRSPQFGFAVGNHAHAAPATATATATATASMSSNLQALQRQSLGVNGHQSLQAALAQNQPSQWQMQTFMEQLQEQQRQYQQLQQQHVPPPLQQQQPQQHDAEMTTIVMAVDETGDYQGQENSRMQDASEEQGSQSWNTREAATPLRQDFGLLAEAAKRAQLAVLMRDFGDVAL